VSDPPKEILAQRYRLIEQIGEGGMGSVWRAEHISLRTAVAIKLLHPKLAGNVPVRARFLREAQAAALLTSTNIVRILDHGVDDDVPYIAMEFLVGESLRTRLKRERTLSPAATAKILAGVARGVARAHRAGIVHRDLKPDNIFITVDEDQHDVVKVVDFGIAKLLDDALLSDGDDGENIATVTGAMLGTPYYMSPEQLRGKKQIDARTDLWSLGVIAYECLTGTRPFVADAIGELVITICSAPAPVPSSSASVPPGFDDWFARAVTIEPDGRFQTIQELADALAQILTPSESWLRSEPGPAPAGAGPPAPMPSTNTPATTSPGSSSDIATATTVIASDEDGRLQSATGGAHSVSSAPPATRGLRGSWLAGAGAALLGIGGLIYAASGSGSDAGIQASASSSQSSRPTAALADTGPRSAEAATAVASAVSTTSAVAITFETVPNGVEVVRDGKSIGEGEGPFTFQRGSAEVTLTFRKKGFVAREVKLVPDSPKSIKVELVRVARPSDVLE
jgi:eukaryotic-like serine/threonine-protein kinase